MDVTDGRITDVPVNLTWTPAMPEGRTVVHAGRMFDGQIAGAAQRTSTSSFATIASSRWSTIAPICTPAASIDAGNDVVMPGLIEMHAHLTKDYGEALGRIWLAYGITSVRNPAANAYEALEDKEAIAAGVRRGPRVFATGGPFDGSRIYYSGGVPLASDAQLPQELQKTSATWLRPDQDLRAARRSSAEAGDRLRARQRHARDVARDLSGGRLRRRRRRAHSRHQPPRLFTEGDGALPQLSGHR